MSIVINDDVIAVEKYSQAYEYKSLGLFEGQYTGYKYPVNFHINNIDYKDYVPAIAVRTDKDFSSTSNNFTHYLDEYEGTTLTYANLTTYRRIHKWYIHNSNIMWNGFIGFRIPNLRNRGSNVVQYIQNSMTSGNYGLLYIIMLKREHIDYYKHCVENKIEPDFSIFEFWAGDKISNAFYYDDDDLHRFEEHLATLEIKVKYGNFNNLIGVPNLYIPKTPTKRRKIASEILDFLEKTRVEENGKKVLIQSSDTKVSDESNAIQEQESSVLLQNTR